MAEVPTTRLNLIKPSVGGSDDTWGGTLNADLDGVDKIYRDLAGALISTPGAAGTNIHTVVPTYGDYADQTTPTGRGFRLLVRSGGGLVAGVPMTLNGFDVKKWVNGVLRDLELGDFPTGYIGDFAFRQQNNDWILLNPGTGLSPDVPAASETVAGILEIATTTGTSPEAKDATVNDKIITPKGLDFVLDDRVKDASTTVKGIIEIAANAELDVASPSGLLAVSAAGLRYITDKLIKPASDTVAGLIEIATNAEADAGTDFTRAITPLVLKHVMDDRAPPASLTVKGVIEIATNAEAAAGTDLTRAITPATLKYVTDILIQPASQSVAGLIETASNAEALDGSSTSLAMTPASTEYVRIQSISRSNNQLAHHNNLHVNWVDATRVSIKATAITLSEGTTGVTRRVLNVDTFADTDIAVGSPGGPDAALAPDVWYAIYVILNPTTGVVSALLSQNFEGNGVTDSFSASVPTLPSGYTFRGFVGAVRREGTSFVRFSQSGRSATILDAGVTLSIADTNWHGVTLLVPPAALSVDVNVDVASFSAAAKVLLAPEATAGTALTPQFGMVRLVGGPSSYSLAATVRLMTNRVLYARMQVLPDSGPGTTAAAALYVTGYTM